jgi:AsmA-like C-terminal region
VKSLVIEGLNIEQVDFGQPLKWASNVSKAKNLKVQQINLKNLMLTIRDLQLESFDGKVSLTDAGTISTIDLVSSNNALSVIISPQGSDYAMILQAANWTLPFNQKLMFSTLNAKATVSYNQINFYQISGEVYGGNITGQASIQWPDGVSPWESSGKFTLTNVNAEQLLNTYGSAVLIDGKLALEGSFSGKAREASKLTEATILSANFDVRQGSIKGVELASAVINRGSHSLAGDSTDFDKLTGSIKIYQDQYQFSKLMLTSPQLNASGFISINANQILTGRINADLAAQSRRLHANFAVTGRGKDLKSQ